MFHFPADVAHSFVRNGAGHRLIGNWLFCFFLRPELFKFESLLDNDNRTNLHHAFRLAHDEFAVPKLLDPAGTKTVLAIGFFGHFDNDFRARQQKTMSAKLLLMTTTTSDDDFCTNLQGDIKQDTFLSLSYG